MHRPIRSFCTLAAFAAAVFACPALAQKGDPTPKPETYLCPHSDGSNAIDCYLDAVDHLYTMCRHIKSIEIIEFGLAGAQEGVNGAKTEYCIDKHKILIVRPYQAALREAARKTEMVKDIRKLYDTWLDSLAKLIPGPGETDDAYKQRVVRPYAEFNDQIKAIRVLAEAPAAPPKPAKASKKK
jgi:hypothetical protein